MRNKTHDPLEPLVNKVVAILIGQKNVPVPYAEGGGQILLALQDKPTYALCAKLEGYDDAHIRIGNAKAFGYGVPSDGKFHQFSAGTAYEFLLERLRVGFGELAVDDSLMMESFGYDLLRRTDILKMTCLPFKSMEALEKRVHAIWKAQKNERENREKDPDYRRRKHDLEWWNKFYD